MSDIEHRSFVIEYRIESQDAGGKWFSTSSRGTEAELRAQLDRMRAHGHPFPTRLVRIETEILVRPES